MVNPPGGGIFKRAPPEVFRRPKRQIMQTQGSGRFAREVTSFSELMAALGSIALDPKLDDTVNFFDTPAREIVISAPFTWEETVELTDAHSGVLLSAVGNAALAHPDGIDCISVNGALGVGLRDLRFNHDGSAAGDYVVRVASTTSLMDLRSVYASGAGICVSDSGANVDDSTFIDCRNILGSGGLYYTIDISGSESKVLSAHGIRVRLRDSGRRCIVANNQLAEVTVGTVLHSVEVASGHGHNVISGNAGSTVGDLSIETSASSGFNTIVGNVRATIASAGTDASAGNT